MNDAIERRATRRIRRPLSVSFVQGEDPRFERVILDNLLADNISAGGLYCRVFGPCPLAVGDDLGVRIALPASAFDTASSPPPPAPFGPYLTGRGEVLRVERIALDGLSGWGVAVRFHAPLEVALDLADGKG